MEGSQVLTVSELAARYHISNRQVQELVLHGYLPVARVERRGLRGICYLFSENAVENLDIPSLLADIRDHKTHHSWPRSANPSADFRNLVRVMQHYERFLEEVAHYPEAEALEICFYLFHLNHYAKSYPERSDELYSLKNQVLKKLYQEHRSLLSVTYLIGPDRTQVWLCEDCKDASRSAGMSFKEYIQGEYYCSKCLEQMVEKEYYSLVEFKVAAAGYRFTFHLPRSSARKWMSDMEQLPQEARKTGRYDDRMYLFGRPISRIEARAFPLPMVVEKLTAYTEDK